MDFILGGTAAMCAGLFTNPFDVIKTRQQLQGELQRVSTKKLPYKNIFYSFTAIVKAEGFRGIQKGLGPALAFQFVMNSTRLGLFQTADSMNLTKNSITNTQSPLRCIFWGGLAGIAGSAVGSPFYMIKTQLQSQAEGQLAVGYQHKHKGTMSALFVTYQEYGVRGLWRGFSSMVPRLFFGSAVQLTTFSKSKEFLRQYEVRISF